MRIGVVLIWILAAFFLGSGTLVHAGDTGEFDEEDLAELYGDEEFVSIATGISKPAYRAPAVASVITADDIKAMGARDLDEVLETVPGLHVSLSTQGRLDSVYSIRGIHTKFNPQVLVLMNGTSFPFFTGGRPFSFRLPVAAIARVEVIRGPGSAVYGADAFAGVINVITKGADDIHGTEVGGRLGSFDTHDLWLQHGGSYAGWDVAFSLEWQKTDGDKDRRVESDFQTDLDKDPSINTDVSLAPGSLNTRYDILDTHLEIQRGDWRLRHWYWRLDDAGLGAGSALALDPAGGENHDQHLVDLTYRTVGLAADWDLSANLNYLHRQSDSRFVLFPPGTKLPIGSDGNLDLSSPNIISFPDGMLGNPDVTDERTGLDLVAIHTGMVSHRWRIGAGVQHYEARVPSETKNFGPGVIDGTLSPIDGTLIDVSGTSNVFMPDRSRTVFYLSLQDEWQFARDWEMTAGIRYDDYSDFGDTVNPRLSLVWAARHNLTAKFLYGRAFRAPSFSEQFSINNPVALGNPGLDPETIDTLELAFDYRPTFDWRIGLSLFAYRADGLIEFVPDPGGSTITAQNFRDQEGYGFELEMGWEASRILRFYGNYAWQHSEDVDTGERIAEAPGQQLYFRSEWKIHKNWSLNPQINWVASRKRAAGDNRPEIDDYTLVDLTLRTKDLFRNWEFALSGRNLFDEEAREPGDSVIIGDYPLEGRNFWAEVSYRF